MFLMLDLAANCLPEAGVHECNDERTWLSWRTLLFEVRGGNEDLLHVLGCGRRDCDRNHEIKALDPDI